MARSGDERPPIRDDDPVVLRARARRARELASWMTDKEVAERLRQLADEFEAMAGAREGER
jgi:hypothetical protein